MEYRNTVVLFWRRDEEKQKRNFEKPVFPCAYLIELN